MARAKTYRTIRRELIEELVGMMGDWILEEDSIMEDIERQARKMAKAAREAARA